MIYEYNKSGLVFNEMKFNTKIRLILPIVLMSLFGGYAISSSMTHPNPIEKLIYEDRLILLTEEVKVSNAALANNLILRKIKFPHIVMAQALHESNRFTSDIFFENNNLFGLRMAGSRPTTALGVNRSYAYYKSWEMSVLDYALYQAAFLRSIKTEAQYLAYLQRNYASDTTYSNNIKRYLKETKPFFKK